MPDYYVQFASRSGWAETYLYAHTPEDALKQALTHKPHELPVLRYKGFEPEEITIHLAEDENTPVLTYTSNSERPYRAAERTFNSLREAVFFAKRGKLFSAYRCFMDAIHFVVEA
jgi:hypothetical protein